MPLSDKSLAILEAIAKGHTYEQILVQELAWTYHDIFQAAAEAIEVSASGSPAKIYSVEEIRHDHPKAYEKWDAAQDAQLRQLFHEGRTVADIAIAMKRQPGGIKSRLVKLDLIGPSSAAGPV
jgi:hypothetical protein